ncbi:MAG TPA: c-type cytochrome [Candidatus Rubrimentiphilum sp.]|nr:c-type cytochrome [Candidatus Rubrimentiphilum sp.]
MKYAALAALCAAMLAACATQSQKPMALYDPNALPTGTPGQLIAYGRELVEHTRAHMGSNVGVTMDCSACHIAAGTKARGGSFVGVYGQFPQWSVRAHRMIALQDRLAECFLYSMNGRPPAYTSREMIAMVAYIAYLSRGIPVGATPDPAVKLVKFNPPQPASATRGAQLYAQRCAICHGQSGRGNAVYPPLWGAHSFNSGAGMHRLWTMAAFVRWNMPQNNPGSLTPQQAYDVSAYVLSHSRPRLAGGRSIAFPGRPARFF